MLSAEEQISNSDVVLSSKLLRWYQYSSTDDSYYKVPKQYDYNSDEVIYITKPRTDIIIERWPRVYDYQSVLPLSVKVLTAKENQYILTTEDVGVQTSWRELEDLLIVKTIRQDVSET